METIKKTTLTFLSELKKNNNSEWFKNNQPAYKEAKANFESFTQEVIKGICVFDPIMKGLEAKSCIFRINRDIRFTNDKSPYKSNFGAFIVRGGKKNGDKFAGYYFHVEPGESFLAGGAYMPPAHWLSAIREKIDQEPGLIKNIINQKEFIKYFQHLGGEKLKTPPRGYTSDNPNIELLKHKSFLAMNNFSDKILLEPDFYKYVIQAFKAMKPLNDFLNDY